MTKKTIFSNAMLWSLFICWHGSVQAQGPLLTKPNAAISYRQALFHLMSAHAQRLGSMAKEETPFDKTTAESDANMIENLARQMDVSFPAGSDIPPSKAKPEIWQDAGTFKQKLADFKIATGKLTASTRSGDINIFKAAYNATAQHCKSCHDGFRNR